MRKKSLLAHCVISASLFDLVELAWGRGAGGEGEISRRRYCSEDAVKASDFKRLCHALPNAVGPLSPSPSPPKQAFGSYLIELAGEPLIQYQTCFKRACFEGEGSQPVFIYRSHRLSVRAIS
ncbi:hypothetical protein FF011L_20720 [Roseimaritima multifibrata]|uniref:Uncharacterized protein n=1 Tax=Roseimaritima multifibrata TaxID=1930274 RepID=A0A517MEJ8_9BACT|nr:hypothetical protein FF011L_20720 [Roseimaritima multifibrata]